jgi:hypothetical protein
LRLSVIKERTVLAIAYNVNKLHFYSIIILEC